MVATPTPELNATLTVSIDGQQDTRAIGAGASVELHFTNELHATLPGFGGLKVRGEQAAVLRDLQTVREAFEREWRPIRTATKCQTLSELELLQEQVRAWQAEASDLTRRASELRIRGEGVEGRSGKRRWRRPRLGVAWISWKVFSVRLVSTSP
jgi:hypothetical protein